MAQQTWREYFKSSVDAQAASTGRDRKEVGAELWELMDSQLELAGLDVETFDFNQPFKPLSAIIEDSLNEEEARLKAEEAAEVARENEYRYRSPSEQEEHDSRQRIGQAVMRNFGQGVAPASESIFPGEAAQRLEGDPQNVTLDRPFTPPPVSIQIPVTAQDAESRYDMAQRLGRDVSQEEYEERIVEQKTDTMLESTVINGKALADLIPMDKETRERQERAIRAADAIREEQEYREKYLSAPSGGGQVPQSYYDKLEEMREQADLLPPEPDYTNREAVSEYVQQLYRNPKVRERIKEEDEEEAFIETGGMLGVAARPFAQATGLVAGTGPLLARGSEVGVLQPALAALSTVARTVGAEKVAEDAERSWYENERKFAAGEHWVHTLNLQDSSTIAMMKGWEENDQKILARLKDKDGWAAISGDLHDNVSGIAHLVASFMPTSLDVLRAIRAKKGVGSLTDEEKADDIAAVQRAIMTFGHGFEEGMKMPAAMAGAILSIIASPYKALQAQPFSTIMTLLPFAKLLKAGGVRGAGRMFDKLDEIAKKAGIDINDPKYQKLTFSENMANKFINEARKGTRRWWGKTVDSQIAQHILHHEYTQGVGTALAEGTRLPGVKFKPGLPLAAKVTTATYVMSQEDLGDAAIALASFGLPAAAYNAIAKHPDYGRKLAMSKAALSRFAGSMAAAADPTLSAKLGELLDRVHIERNKVESDFKSLNQALWSKEQRVAAKLEASELGGLKSAGDEARLTVESAVPSEAQILLTHAAMKGRVDAMPSVARLNRAKQDAYYVYEHAKEAGMEPAALEKLKTDALNARNAWRRERVEKFAENLDEPNYQMPETGTIITMDRLLQRRRDLKIDLEDDLALVDIMEAEHLNRINKADTPEKLAALKDELLDAEMQKVLGPRAKLTSRDFQAHLDQLDRAIEALQNEGGIRKSDAIRKYESKLKEAQEKYNRRMKDCN